jgi:hypothetical protein
MAEEIIETQRKDEFQDEREEEPFIFSLHVLPSSPSQCFQMHIHECERKQSWPMLM